MTPKTRAAGVPVPALGLHRLRAVPQVLLPGEADFAAVLVRFAPAETVPRESLAAFFLLRGAPDRTAALRRVERYVDVRFVLGAAAPAAMHGVPVASSECSALFLGPHAIAPPRAPPPPDRLCERCTGYSPRTIVLAERDLCRKCERALALLAAERQACAALGLAPSGLAACFLCRVPLRHPGALVCHGPPYPCRAIYRRLYGPMRRALRTLRAPGWRPPPGQSLLPGPPHDGRAFVRGFAVALHRAARPVRQRAPSGRDAPPLPAPAAPRV